MDDLDREVNRLGSLFDDLDFHPRYNLRHTDDRQRRLQEFFFNIEPNTHTPDENTNANTPTAEMSPPGTSGTPSSTHAHTHTSCNTVLSPSTYITSKFCGHVPETHPDRQRLMSYDVERWLSDTETRILCKNITGDSLKIKEALLAVDSTVGDACRVLNTGRMSRLTDYSEFKRKCRNLWARAADQDRYLALSQFFSVSYNGNIGDFIADLERGRDGIVRDLENDKDFRIAKAESWVADGRKDDLLVSLDEVLNYVSWGIIFKGTPPKVREAFRKVNSGFSGDYMDLLSAVRKELMKSENRNKVELAAVAQTVNKYKNEKNHNSQNGWKGHKKVAKQEAQTGSVDKSKLVCFACGKRGHTKAECHKASGACFACGKPGHKIADCHVRKQKENTYQEKRKPERRE